MPDIYKPLGWYYIVAWNKLYHKSVFQKIKFPVGKIHEDEFIIVQIMDQAKKIACVKFTGYFYLVQRKGSIMNKKDVQAQCDWLEALYERFFYCQENKMPSEAFIKTTRAIYFRELNNLYLDKKLSANATKKQKKIAKRHYGKMKGKSITEIINWILFLISPITEKRIVDFVRKNRNAHGYE